MKTSLEKKHYNYSRNAELKRIKQKRIILGLPNYTFWNILVLVFVITDFYLTTLCFSLLEAYTMDFVPFFIISDSIYIFNLALLFFHRFWKKLSTKLSQTVRTSSPILIMDLASILPQVTLLLIYFRPNYKNIILYCRLVICLRLHRSLFFRKLQQELLQRRWMWFLMENILYLLIILHATNTVWILITRQYSFCTEMESWHRNESYMSLYNLKSVGKWYFFVTYLNVQTLFNVGFGDINSLNICETFWFMITMIIGQLLCITLIAMACWLMINRKFHGIVYSQMVSYDGKYVENLTNPTKNHVQNYYKYLWENYSGIHDASLLHTLPLTLQMDVAFDINCGLLSKSLLLKGLPIYIQRKIALAMKSILLIPNQSIYDKGVTKKYMVWIKRGTLQAIYDGAKCSTIFFTEGAVLGEASLFLNLSSKITVRAAKYSELRILDKTSFLKIMLHYPKELKMKRNMIAHRIDRIVHETSEPIASQNLRTLKAKRLEIGDTNVGNYSEYLSLYKLSKNAKLREAQAGIFNMVTENVVLMKIWLLLVAAIETFYCLWYPYYAVFERYVPYDVYIFGIVADSIYFLDVLLQCVTVVKFKNKIVTKVLEIIDVKLEHWTFYCDVFSLFPIEVWAYFIENPTDRGRIYDLLRLNRLLRIWRVRYFFELLENGNSYIVETLKYTTYSVIFTYFTSCLLYLTACLDLICQEESWYHQKIVKDLQMSKDIQYGESTLSTSMYFAAMSVCHTGLGDVLPKSGSDIAIVAFVILISVTLKTYCTSQIISFMFLKELCAKTYELFFYLKMSFNHFQLPQQIKRRLKRYITSTKYFPEKHVSSFIKNSTSNLIQDEIKLSKIQNSLSNLPFLKMADPYFIAILEKEAKVLCLPENEILYNWGDRIRNMYVLQQGYCNLYTANQLLEQTVGPGTQLGVIEMLSASYKKHTVIAITDCIIVYLEHHSFSNILKLFPTEYKALEDVLQSQWFHRMMRKVEHKTNKENFGVLYRQFQTKALIITGWKKLWETYRLKLGVFWALGFLFGPFAVHPECIFMKVWCAIRCLLIIAFGLALPLITMLPPFVDSLYWLIFICQCSLYIDMFILLHTAYYDDTGQLETLPLYTAWHYITHSFALDLLASLSMAQISLFFDLSSSNHYNAIIHTLAPHYRHCKWRLLGLVQIHRVFSYLNYLKTVRWELRVPVEIIKITGMVALLINVLASLMLSIVCSYEFDQTYATSKHSEAFYDPANNATYYGVIKCQNGFWLNNSVFSNVSEPSGLYAVATYSVINFMTHTGLGDITGQEWLPMIEIVVTIFIGYALFLFICALVVTKMLEKVSMGMDFRKKVEQLELFLKNNSIPIDLRKKVNSHLKFLWQRTKGLNYSTIISDFELNSTLSDDVLLTQYHSCLKYCAVFQNLDINGLRLIVKYMKICHYKNGDIITDYKEVIGDIFIVASGKVQIFSKDHYCVDTFGIGGVFGNIHQSIHSCTEIYVKARNNVELCAIATEELLNIMTSYPNIFHRTKEMLTQGLEYVGPYNLPATGDDDKRFDFCDEIESDDDLQPKRKSSVGLINPLVALKPHHCIFKTVAFLTVMASCINAIFIPYVFVTQDRHYISFLYLIFEPIFYIRIYMKLRQAYYNFYGNIVKSKRKIIQRYFNIPTQVLWDAISNFPLALVCFVREERFFLYTCLRMLHLLRIYYILEYFKVHEEKFKLRIWLPVLKLGLIYIILIHLFSCFWLMMACPFDQCHSETWISQNSYMMKKPSIFKLLLSYYYVISSITTTGTGDILPQNICEVIVTSVFMLVGKLMIIIFIGTILRFMYITNFDLVRFEYKATLLKKHLQNQDISNYQMRKIWSYTQNLWKHNRGNNFPKLLFELPHVLTCDVMMCLYGHHLHQNVLFKNTDEALLRQICSKFERQLFFHYDCIVRSGDISSSMYFIQSGSVSVLTEHGDLSETEHVVLQPNDMFGISQGFGNDTPYHFTYRAASDLVEVLTLPFQSWLLLLPYFPQDKAVIFARMQKKCGKV